MKRILPALALLPMAAMAELEGGQPRPEPVDSAKTVALQEVQVLSTRAGASTPMAHTDLGKEALREVNHGRDIPFLLALTPSVTTTSDAGNGIGYTSIRVRGTDPTRINVTANGVPINDSESNNVYWTNMPDFASSVESVQLQRGVGTSTNGSGAFGATINMQTENIGVSPFLGLDASAGSYGSHKEALRFGTGLLGGHWGFQGRLSDLGSDGYIDRGWSRLGSYFLQGGYFSERTVVKLITFNGKEETYHAWNYPSLAEMEEFGRTYNSCGYMYTDEQGVRHYYGNQVDYYHQQHYQLLLNQMLGSGLALNVAIHYTRGSGYYEEYKRKRTLAEYGLTDDWGKVADLVRRKQMDNDFYGAIASLSYEGAGGLAATVGGGWNRYDGDHYGTVEWVKGLEEEYYPGHTYYDNNAVKVDGNIYGKVSYEFVKGLSAYVDLQYRHVGYRMRGPADQYDWDTMRQVEFGIDEGFDFLNPKAGLYWRVAKGHDVYASFALAHKEPTRNDYEDNLMGDLKAERLCDWELGYRLSAGRLSAGVNLYYMDYANQFVLTGEKDQIGDMVARNVGKSHRMGMEIEAAWRPVDFFRWDLNATLSQNRAKDWHVTDDSTGESVSLGDTPLSFSPGFILGSSFRFEWKGLTASLACKYVGPQYLTNTGFREYVSESESGDTRVSMMIDGCLTADLDVAYRLRVKGLKGITLGCTVYNLFSAKYMNNGWSAPSYRSEDGKMVAYTIDDAYETGYAVSAPINFMAHLSFDF